MQKIFLDSRRMDESARKKFFVTEEIMMENAAAALEKSVLKKISRRRQYMNRPTVLILAGKGNNGGDGYALARKLCSKKISVVVCAVDEPKTEPAKSQAVRAEKSGAVKIDANELDSFAEEKSFDLCVVVDCIFGAGFRLPLDEKSRAVIQAANGIDAYKISCDVPSGIDKFGNGKIAFRADETISCGTKKICHTGDDAKIFCGKIKSCNLGISRTNYQGGFLPDAFLLEKKDFRLPLRKKISAHKGDFGHAAIISGEKKGASKIAAKAAFSFGAGLVTLVGAKKSSDEIMTSKKIPENANAILFGTGFGRGKKSAEKIFSLLAEKKEIPCVLDADAFYYDEIDSVLKARNSAATILTPHPKEFSVLLEKCGMGKFSVEGAKEKRFELARKFAEKFPQTVLILKGAVVLIAKFSAEKNRTEIFFNPLGTVALAKGGSGDVLSGLAVSLLAQKFQPVDAAISASLAHALASGKFKKNFSLTPNRLIKKIRSLEEKK
jgi:hydroxyethylthiazole kinase-like uncharacterized protein yjeF